MSSTGKESEGKSEKESKNAVIEIKISIPPTFGDNISGILNHLGKAAGELAKAGRAFVGSEESQTEPKKIRKIEIK